MKILFVTNMYPNNTGPYYGIFVKEQIDGISRKYPIEYDIFFVDGREDKWAYLKSIFTIHKKIENSNYDLIHIHYGFSGLFLLKRLKKKIPVIMTLHGGDIQVEQGKWIQVFITKQILKRAQIAFTLNNRMDQIVKQYTHRTIQLPCSVNTDLFKPIETVKEAKKDSATIIFPGDSTRKVKNYPLFSQTLDLLQKRYGISCKRVELKNMNRQEVAELYQNSDLLLMTSISEGSPQSVKEAMASNLSIVSTNVGDVEYLLEGVANSIVVKDFDPELLAENVYLSLAKRIPGINGREKLLQLELDDDSVAEKIYHVYQELLSQKL